MELRFLGTGTSTGIPVLRCHCKVCTSTDPRDRRLRASVIVRPAPDCPWILIDCGPDLREQLLREGSPDLCAALLTHSHYDHVGGIDDLRPYTHEAPGGRFPLYCLPDVERDLRDRVPYCFAEKLYPGVPTFTIHSIKPGSPFSIACGDRAVEITPLPVLHGRLPIVGYRIGPMAYITDCSVMPKQTIELLRGVDTLVINALRHKSHLSHMSIGEALEVVREVAPRRTYFTHMSDGAGLHSESHSFLPDGVEFAYDTLCLEL